jgi:hypothetical protein
MSIPFGCECGKRLQAKEEFAGKKMKCPGCGKILVIPGGEPPPEARQREPAAAPDENGQNVAAGTPAPAPDPAVVQFVCSCGRRLKARREDAGAEIDCPECGRSLRIPAADTDTPPAPAAAPPLLVGDGFLSQTVTPWPDAEARRRGADGPDPLDEPARSWLWAVAALVLVGVAAWWYFGPQITAHAQALQPQAAVAADAARAPFDELRIVPGDALGVLTLQPRDPGAPPHRELNLLARQALGRLVPADAVTTLNNRVGQVERLTLVTLLPSRASRGVEVAEKDAWLIVRTVSPHLRKALTAQLWPKSPPPEPKKYQGMTYFVVSPADFKMPTLPMGKGEGKPGIAVPPRPRLPAVFFVSPQVFVICDDVSVKRLLRGKRPGMSGPQDAAAARARPGVALVVGLNQYQAYLNSPNPPPAANLPLTPALKQFTSAIITVEQARGEGQGERWLKEELEFEFQNPKVAEAAQKSLMKWKDEQSQRLAEAREKVMAKQAGRAQAALQAVLWAAGSVRPGQLTPPGLLTIPPPDMTVPEEDAAELARLKAETAFLEGFAEPSVSGKAVKLRLLVPPDAAGLAGQMWAPYADLAVSGLPSPRVQPGPPIKKGPGKKKVF